MWYYFVYPYKRHYPIFLENDIILVILSILERVGSSEQMITLVLVIVVFVVVSHQRHHILV